MRRELQGWDDPTLPRGPDVSCTFCPLVVGTRVWDGRHYMLNPHATTGYAPRGDWCPMSKGAVLRYSPSFLALPPSKPSETPPWPPQPRPQR